MKILAIIPARSLSKSIKNKNIKLLNGVPLLKYSIDHALNSKLINRVILDTDSKEYAKVGLEYGAECPYIRPEEFATDLSTDFDVFFHAIDWLKVNENYLPDIIVQLRPTYPYRSINDIDNMINILISNSEFDSVRSIAKSTENPYKMWVQNYDKSISPLFNVVNGISEPYNQPRQKLPVTFIQNAAIDVFWTKTILDLKSMTGNKILGYIIEHNYDIDYQNEFDNVQKIMKKNEEDLLL